MIIHYHSHFLLVQIKSNQIAKHCAIKNHSFLLIVSFSVAGTSGAVITCPLEVVKTRLQSSNAFLSTPTRSTKISESSSIQNSYSALRRPEQRRKFSSTILKRVRPQVIRIYYI